jgi:hypothetical protein
MSHFLSHIEQEQKQSQGLVLNRVKEKLCCTAVLFAVPLPQRSA